MFYQSVGDDLVVTDPDSVFGKLFETIGVKINLAKCKGSTPNGVFAEFVSRSLWEGKEYSLLSPKLVSKTIKQAYLIPTMLGHVRERCDVNLSISLEDILSAGSKPGISEAKRQAHIDQTVKVFEVYQVLTGNQILTTGDK